jgi:pimeloyl-ACP methyl ester carboxylesterase
MKHLLLSLIVVFLTVTSCQKEVITPGRGVSETFYIDNNGASMRLLVKGNTLSKVFIILVPGGPGAGAFFYNTDYINNNIGNKYAMVYWDERNSGAAQGASNGKYLTLGQMTDDLVKVIQVIKARYGQDCSLFLIGHSFGGLLTSSFMTSGNNQSMVKGWIFADGSHNYPLNDTLTRQMLFAYGKEQILLNRNKSKWEVIVSYCEAHSGNFSYKESVQLETYASEAENYFIEVNKINQWELFKNYAVRDDWPLTSMLMNYLYSSEAEFNETLAKTEFSSTLNNVTVPVLILYGQYDFICPKDLGVDFYNRIGSTDKKIVISPVSGHNIMLQDEVLFCYEVNLFVDTHR